MLTQEQIRRLIDMARRSRDRAEPGLDPLRNVRERASDALDAIALETAADLGLRELARDAMMLPKLTSMREWASELRPDYRANVLMLCDAVEDCALSLRVARERLDSLQRQGEQLARVLSEIQP